MRVGISVVILCLSTEGAFAQDFSRERVDRLSKLSDSIYSHHESHLVLYSRGADLTTYFGDYTETVIVRYKLLSC